MFTNTYSVNPTFPCFPSSSYPPLFLNHENSETLLLHDPAAFPFLPSNHTIGSIPQAAINFAVNDSKLSNGNVNHFGLSNFLGRKSVKKDRHSKICTAQGVRDRRVRLSIGIARKFFDLQDMLGFDKASKTLEWLLNKSKKAIKEFARTKQSSSGGVAAKCLSSSSECEVVSGINEGENLLQGVGACNKPLMLGGDKNRGKLKRTQSEIAKESRAKARARARERTRDKICTRLHDSSTSRRCSATSQIVHHSKSLMHTAKASTDKPTKLFAEIEHYDLQLADAHQVQRVKVLEEPAVMKKKPKPFLTSSSGQSIMVSESKDESFNHRNFNCNSLFPNFITPNWDISGATAHSTSCSITDVNLSTELQIFGKPWDVYDSQRLN